MKNTILWSTLFALLGTQVHADTTTQPVTPPPQQTPGAMPQAPVTPTPPGQNIPSVQPAQAPAAPINCEYKIPPETKTIDQSLVIKWATKAVTQAFDFNSNNLDSQLQKLQPCFTEQGWTGFNTALQKSGNLEAIKSQKLTVSSQVMGQIVVTEAKDNQWKINLPLQVVYQNDKEKVTQLLSVDVTIGRKITGDLGITQMIAAPRGTVTQQLPSDFNPNPATVMNPNIETTTPTTAPTTTTPTNPTTQPAPPTTSTQPTSANPSATQTPATPGQPTLPENRSTQPSLPANTP
ncbi:MULTISPECIES: DotI/IcmL family type IV secretion protein [Legionella]|uniref:DotI/IcmL family type IV secretion protein n=1 Tax=Legionella resiliens TaxID=2905958 RepID=A0ABS8X2H8_9GAMM|nr:MULTISPECIES: DotI/IcmL family type IV secretion protein [unclassified Legionella]MCE0723036.1 DotI/IcmL family type IV secretion protein [Legionella sp. 9fVS26]MCE3532189.1 DotI/IcmL family type IV secretion protein [Legionella sp. 8cVS16]QLZ68316.1 type IV secretion system protein IcmL [Legionella sp. PC1000]